MFAAMKKTFFFLLLLIVTYQLSLINCFAQNKTAENLNRLGVQHFDSLNYVAAINCFTKALSMDSANHEYYSNRATTYYSMKQYPQALADIDKALALKKDFPGAYYLRGNIKDKSGDKEGAHKDFTKELIFNPACFKCYYNIGNIYMEKKDYTLAVEMFAKSSAIEPTFSEAYNNSGIAHYQMKDKVKACADWKKAFELGNKEAGKDLSRFCN